jgi:hypothetical protein
MGGNSRNPVQEYGIIGKSGHPTEQESLARIFFCQYKKKGDKGDPGEKSQVKFGKGKGRDRSA